ncbi:MAG: DNA starvation/stationary phase protection protein [Flavobacterium sp.]|jgi:starvation-inducible DNA-binding protein|uniref:Dps family protein n=1 Tax=Flavobacterium sp. TaxID=239 RepID=UPI002BB70902|nr:DNA starvation/stationary phase protection protein [Flavobacterium sp.]HQA73731.1 DNA starvation/stationary phase protection protein [Flavobacterium sp.]
MEAKIGLPKKDLTKSIDDLTVLLANEMILYVKTRKFHWNISGNSFMELHKLFEQHYNSLAKTADEVAERISALGGNAIGSMKNFLKHGEIEENTKDSNTQKQMLDELLEDHQKTMVQIRKAIDEIGDKSNDVVTEDFLTGILKMHENISWQLRKYTN